MTCSTCNIELKKALFYGTEVDYCSQCLGLWFNADELRQAKDEKDKNLNWLDIDLWQDETKFKIAEDKKICPECSVPLYSVNYGDSGVEVDICNICQGVWLDRGEFRKIMDYLKAEGKEKVLKNYFQNIIEEALEVFTGPENFRSEIADFLAIMKILNYKLMVQHKVISQIILAIGRAAT